jgi:hypothetical protein
LGDQLDRLNGRLVAELTLLDGGDECGGFAVPTKPASIAVGESGGDVVLLALVDAVGLRSS